MPPPPARPAPGRPPLRLVNGGPAKAAWAKPAAQKEQEERVRRERDEREAQERADREAREADEARQRVLAAESEDGGKTRGKKAPYVHEPYTPHTYAFLTSKGAPVLLLETHAGMETQTHHGLMADLQARMRAQGFASGVLVTQAIVQAVFEGLEVFRYEGAERVFSFRHTGTVCLGATAQLWKMAGTGHPLLPPEGLMGFAGQAMTWLTALAERGKQVYTSTHPEAPLLEAVLRRHGGLVVNEYRGALLPLPVVEEEQKGAAE